MFCDVWFNGYDTCGVMYVCDEHDLAKLIKHQRYADAHDRTYGDGNRSTYAEANTCLLIKARCFLRFPILDFIRVVIAVIRTDGF